MRKFVHLSLLAAFVATTALAGCASKQQPPPPAATVTSAAMSGAGTSSGAMSSGAMPQKAMVSTTMPTCSAADPVVWVNTSTKVFHSRGDAYFGKTKHGGYMCTAAAIAAGDHAAKRGSSAMTGAAEPAVEATKKPKHRKGAPAPDAT